MRRRITLVLFALICLSTGSIMAKKTSDGQADRKLWVRTLLRISDPVLSNLANETLKSHMPYQSLAGNRQHYSYLEALGRTVCGIAPWLELGPDPSEEGRLREKYIAMTVKAISNAVNPSSPDYMKFSIPTQSLVDAAFLAEGLLRAPKQLWGNLDETSKQRVIYELKQSRLIKPNPNNWLLFTSMVEAALLEFTGECDLERLTYGVKRFQNDWYCGDGQYSDGKKFHVDYYNSFVIHPMLTDILVVMRKHQIEGSDFLEVQYPRLSRYAEQLERMISPEGTYPVVGRSIVYRVGVFHALGQAALLHKLPKTITPAQVRCGMTQVLKKQFKGRANFDANGWLTVGFNGNQISISEEYINTGSTYLCVSGFLPLGLSQEDDFWSLPYAEWTNLKAWGGEKVKADHAISN